MNSAVPAYELVLHHDYAGGGTVDRSGNGNDGYRVGGPDAAPGDVTVFDGRTTRVVVPPSPTLARLGAIRVRARIRLDEMGDRRTIVEGYLSFAFVVEPDGALGGSIYTGKRWDEIRTLPGTVALGRWVDVALAYDGRDTAALLVDGAVTATRYVPLGEVGGVEWPYGLNVGAWPDRDLRVFAGRIAELWLWRSAP